ncbi:polyphenol oxidase family protein [Streptomyces sp. MAR4 CNX-425]|uniref:polyphenol oxidase family protein n=1 Tax=Streptomyces sp. MAR4 CNX-425 TaxID=3406343 RepID=UPI003B5035BB
MGQTYTTGGAHFAFTDRWGGVSAAPYAELNLGGGTVGTTADSAAAVAVNRDRAARSLGVAPERVVWMHQVHGRDVAVVDGPWGESPPPAVDAVVTRARGVPLAARGADCVPLLLADPRAGVAGAAHAGRPGMVAGVAGAAVEAMAGLGAAPARIVAHLGPAVCGRCYEVPEALRDEAGGQVPAARATTSWGTPALDIRAGVVAQLEALGVGMITVSEVCTLESGDHFSYRREGATGRHAGYVWLDGE